MCCPTIWIFGLLALLGLGGGIIGGGDGVLGGFSGLIQHYIEALTGGLGVV